MRNTEEQQQYLSLDLSPATRVSFEDSSNSINDHLLEKEVLHSQPSRSFCDRHRAFLTQLSIFLIYITTISILVVSNRTLRSDLHQGKTHSPAGEAVEWEVTKWHLGNAIETPYTGKPRPELEAAWKGLLGNMNIRLPEETIKTFGRQKEAIKLPDGGYLGSLNVYHEIHCLRWLHKYFYQEDYFPGIDDHGRQMNLRHSEHCLSYLLEFAKCHSDVGAIIYSWSPSHPRPGSNGTVHQCVNWDKIASWTKERAVDVFKPGYLIHPTLGPAYPDVDTQTIE